MSGAGAGIVLSFLLATAFATFFHVLFGGSAGRIVLYIVMSFVGFMVGHFIGRFLQINWLKLGAINLLSASIGSWLLLFFSRWLWRDGTSS